MIYQLNKDYFVRALSESDLEGAYPGWFEDQEVCRYNSHGKFFQAREYFREYLNDSNRKDRIVWAICHVVDGHIGNVSLQDISLINRTAEFAILLGDKRHWGKGVGTLVGRKLLEHGFEKLGLERIHCGTAATNKGMKKLAATLGMSLEGTRRKHLFLEGARVDMLEYGILRTEFEENAAP
ncbi:MAG: GNAT family N-acetyltransferase [Gammaproteobacteria bacterium]|nr:GNAT family N-acetyltransferase [Gammaproteobacteria bacterium]MBU1624027.1 GNAT family N-acetyltransferase [Gammaproteobacteria bacterium]MBU1981755.1 GNAT family N-acetyltransferase [Gammaproteobacteria bacterium]